MIYGDTFSISKKTRRWLKIKIKNDGYKGYITKQKYATYFKPSHKVNVLKASVYKFPNYRKKFKTHVRI